MVLFLIGRSAQQALQKKVGSYSDETAVYSHCSLIAHIHLLLIQHQLSALYDWS